MTSLVFPITASTGPDATARDVLDGLDLSDRLAVVTGGYSGIGLETTRALAAAGATVVVPARRPAEANSALAGLDRVEVDSVDLADLESVVGFADRFCSTDRAIDILIAGAGIMATPETRVGPGWESQLAVNHLGHFALVARLWPALTAGRARVVVVVSGVSRIHWQDLQFDHGYDKWAAYLQSKTANRLFALHLDRLGAPAGVRSFSVTPGFIRTPLQRHLPHAEMVAAGWIDDQGAVIDPSFVSAEQGAAPAVWLSTSPTLAGHGGLHADRLTLTGPIADTLDPNDPNDPNDTAGDAARLWATSAKLTGTDIIVSGLMIDA